MKLHWLLATVLVGLVALLPTQSDAYIGILYFRNLETGDRGKVVNAHPGDQIQVGFDFFTSTGQKWKELSFFLDQVGSSIITDDVALGIVEHVNLFFASPTVYQSYAYGPAPIYNSRKFPGDTTKTKITDEGIYARIDVDQTKAQSETGISDLFQFTVPQTAIAGETLNWGRPNLPYPDDVSTRLIDAMGGTGNLQLNSLLVVPEPTAIAGFVVGLAGIAALRRRR